MGEWKKIPKATQFSRWVINCWARRECNLSAKWLGKFLITFQWTGKYPRYLLDLLQRAVGAGWRFRDEINQIFRQESVYTLRWLFSFVWWRLDDFLVTQKKPLGAKIVSCFFFFCVNNEQDWGMPSQLGEKTWGDKKSVCGLEVSHSNVTRDLIPWGEKFRRIWNEIYLVPIKVNLLMKFEI